MSPGVRWGPSILPGQDITREISTTSPPMSFTVRPIRTRNGQREFLNVILGKTRRQPVQSRSYYQQGGIMGASLAVWATGSIFSKADGARRISDMTLLKTGRGD